MNIFAGLLDEPPPAAIFSPCRTWRYVLRRQWAPGPVCGFILLNPSTADETQDDPTIRRCIAYAKSWGYGSLILGNLFAFRATDPRDMKGAADPIGPENDAWLAHIEDESHITVCGWGAHGEFMDRGEQVLQRLRAPLALALTMSGHPGHPLYLKSSLEPFEIEPTR